jgi:uncharacterized membrane protein
MALASSLQNTASKLMGKFGGALTYRRVSGGAYNASTGAITETVTDYSLRGVLQDVKAREVNELIQAGDKRLFIAATDLAVAPSTADRVIIAAVSHQIINVQTIEQDNQPITYELVLRA